MRQIVLLIALVVTQNAVASCGSTLPERGSREDVLLIVNNNSKSSCAVAEHYAEARRLGQENILSVYVPPTFFIDWKDFSLLRDQIIAGMQAKLARLDPDFIPASCSGFESPYFCPASTYQLRSRTPIRYIVLTKGIPTRFTLHGGPAFNKNLRSAFAPTSVDNYLRHWLIHYFDKDQSFSTLARKRAVAFLDGRGMRLVNPATDFELIVGRIDGLTSNSAQRLVDRAILAEHNGVYGKLYGYAPPSLTAMYWKNAAKRIFDSEAVVYGDRSTSWRYQFGIFGERTERCSDYLDPDHYLNFHPWRDKKKGKSPNYCTVKINRDMKPSADPAPGRCASRHPIVDDALVYIGEQEGQATVGGRFQDFLHWRKRSCTGPSFIDRCDGKENAATLCRNSPDPIHCREASEDVFKEIDTRCVGVADGFIGHNMISFPASYLAAWPTDWYFGHRTTKFINYGGGDFPDLAFPEVVRGDSADGDGFSLWFRFSDAVKKPACYINPDFSNPPNGRCRMEQNVNITSHVELRERPITRNGESVSIRLRFHYKARNLQKPVLLKPKLILRNVRLKNERRGNIVVYDRAAVYQRISNTEGEWREVDLLFRLDPDLHFPAKKYDGIRIHFETDRQTPLIGELGLDAVSIQEDGYAFEMLSNPSFSQGHKQLSTGDHAVSFLNRINGTAFWGSVGHHESGGASFLLHPLETLIYFIRGLPIGDAVWFWEGHNSGVLYGDPLYSPIAVRLDYLPKNQLQRKTVLSGDAVNGTDTENIETSFRIDFCAGDDFFHCDRRDSAWRPTGLQGTAGRRGMKFGTWDTSDLAPGVYTIRLGVRSRNRAISRDQTFYDYLVATKP